MAEKMTVHKYLKENEDRCIYCKYLPTCSMGIGTEEEKCKGQKPEELSGVFFDLAAIEEEQINPVRFCTAETAWNRRRRRVQKEIYEAKARLGLTGIKLEEAPGLAPLINELIQELTHQDLRYLRVPMTEIYCRWKGYEMESSSSLYYDDYSDEVDDLTFLFHALFEEAGYQVKLEGELAPFLRIALPEPKHSYYYDI